MKIPYYKVGAQLKGSVVKLNANEGLDFLNKKYKNYPQPQPVSCIRFFSEFYGVNSDEILMTNGIDGGLDAIFKFVKFKGLNILSFDPTYGYYEILAKQMGIQYRQEKFLDDGKIPKFKELIKKTFVVLCRPNNPTGEVCSKEDIFRIIKNLDEDSYLFIDEAYMDFYIKDGELTPLVKNPKILIGRTLSKAIGLAGLRVGFILGRGELLNEIRCFLPPYPISSSTIDILNNLIKENYFEKIKNYFPVFKKRKEKLESIISDSIYYYQSKANFISIKSNKASCYFKKGLEEGLLFRFFEEESILRISIPEEKDFDKVLKFFERVFL